MANEIEKIEQRIAETQAKLAEEKRKLKQAQKQKQDKLIRQVGTKVINETKISDLKELESFQIVRRGQFEKSQSPDNLERQLKAIAQKLVREGNEWRFPKSQELYEWLAKFRIENQTNNH